MRQQMTNQKDQKTDILRMTTDVVSAYVGNNTLPPTQLNDVIQIVYGSLQKLDGGQKITIRSKAAIAIRKSITPDYIVCLEDGKRLKMLKRHLRTAYGMTPQEYRAKWGLPLDYPMVAPNYSRQRSAFAKKIGLGHTASTVV